MFILFSVQSMAGGRTNWAEPTQIDIERGNGLMIYGAFGNGNNCTVANKLYIKADHPQYNKIYAAVLAAFTSGYQIRAYIHTCEPVPWYTVPSTTYNVLTLSGDLNIKK